jgi:hypothetical protein
MKRILYLCGLVPAICFMAISCTPKTPGELPVVDVTQGLLNTRKLNLSDFVDRVEYIKLETRPDCLIAYGQVAMAGDFLVVKTFRPSNLLVFDRRGKFVRQIGRQGQGPGEYVNFQYFDVSPDGRYVAISGMGEPVKLYSTEGTFLRAGSPVSPFLSGFRFLDPGHLVIHNARTNQSRVDYPMILSLAIPGLKPDTLLTLDLSPLPNDSPFSLVYTGFYPYDGGISFMEALNDTLYQLKGDLKRTPRLVFNCGDKAVTGENLFISSNHFPIPVYPIGETGDYLFFSAGRGDNYRIMVFDKSSGETFQLPVRPSRQEEKTKIVGPENDLDGTDFSFNGIRIDDREWISLLQISDLKAFIGSVGVDELHLRNRKYDDELRQLAEDSNQEDNPIVRILYLR